MSAPAGGPSSSEAADSGEAEGSLGGASSDALLRKIAHFSDASLSSSNDDAETFGGTSRFIVSRCLGAGGFGAVYEVHDTERQASVALKVLHRADARSLYGLKREFRSLADLSHANLITLYELFAGDERWFFTMELLRGKSFQEHVHGPREPLADVPAVLVETLHDALRQLGGGLAALHAAGKLHCDLKPSNVLVTEEGRLVIVDFGLVAEASPAAGEGGDVIRGTPAFMSPEQAAGAALSPASDWYSVGTMLFLALTGQLPFPEAETRSRKRREEAPRASSLVRGVPDELDRLCADLLCREPQGRPTGEAFLARLRAMGPGPEARPPHRRLTRPSPGLLVGREPHLEALQAAYRHSRDGGAAVVLCHGGSGMGKSALLQSFLACVKEDDARAVVLAGRCFEHENVPFKALDGIVDALSQLLEGPERAEAKAIPPRDAQALARLFPVLGWITAIQAAPPPGPADARQLQKTAFVALRGLLQRLSARRPLLLSIDDLHWGDLDSVALLGEILRPPAPPRLLLLVAYRSEEAETSPALAALTSALRGEPGAEVLVRELAVSGLGPLESMELAQTWLGAGDPERVQAITAEAQGNPFFLVELCEHAGEAPASSGRAPSTVDEMIAARARGLPEAARQLLEVVAVAGQPVLRASARQAAFSVATDATTDSGEPQALSVLRARHLLRVRQTADREELLPYHDRVRETIAAGLSPAALTTHHDRLATVLEASGQAEPERLAFHFQHAGRPAEAARHAVVAGRRAHESLAFDRASRSYRMALSLGTFDVEAERDLRVRFSETLAATGHLHEAAEGYLAVAGRLGAEASLPYRQQAAELLFSSGRLERGFEIEEGVLAELGVWAPRSALTALLYFLVLRLVLRARGLGFRERPEGEVPPRELLRIDACSSAALGEYLRNPIRAVGLQARHLLLTLRAGEPRRLSRALARDGMLAAARGEPAGEQVERAFGLALSLAERGHHPGAVAHVLAMQGNASYLRGRFAEGESVLLRAEAILRERCADAASELERVHLTFTTVLWWQGKLKELSVLAPHVIERTRATRNRYVETLVCLRAGASLRIAEGALDEADETLRAAMEGWPIGEFAVQHHTELLGRLRMALYAGDAEGAYRLVNQRWPALSRSRLLGCQLFRGEAHFMRGLVTLAAAKAGARGARGALRVAASDARRLAAEATPWLTPLALLLRAGLAHRQGRVEEGAALLVRAEEGFERASMGLFAISARRRRGEWTGGDEGRALSAEADAWMRAQGIRAPERFVDAMAP